MAKHKKKNNKNRRSGNPYPNKGEDDTNTTKNRARKTSSTSQDIAKDPDPGTIDQEFVDNDDSSMRTATDHPCLQQDYKLSNLYDESQKAIDHSEIGNVLYDFWYSDCPQEWTAQVFHYSEQFLDPPERETFEGAATNIMASLGNCPFALEDFLDKIFAMSEADRENEPAAMEDYYMSCRRLVMATAARDPTRLFGLNSSSRDSLSLKYWDCSNSYNPTFRVGLDRPYAIFWILSTELMGNPWVDNDGETCETIELFETLQDELIAVRKRKAQRQPPINSEVKGNELQEDSEASASSPSRDAPTAAAVTPQQQTPPKTQGEAKVSFNLPGKEPQVEKPTSNNKIGNEEEHQSSQDESTDTDSETDGHSNNAADSDMDTSTEASSTKAANQSEKASKKDQKKDESEEDIDNEFDLNSIVNPQNKQPLRRSTRQQSKSESEATSKPSASTGGSPKKAPPKVEKKRLASSSKSSEARSSAQSKDPQLLKDPPPLQRNNQGRDSSSYRDKAAAPPKLLSDDQKVRNLTQISMLGLRCKHAQFFNITMGFHWSGNALEGCTLPEKLIKSIKEYLAEILELDDDIIFLPVSDNKYNVAEMWISTVEQLDELISDMKTLKPYIDVTYGSAGWIAKQPDKLGDKLLRTRMRVGSDSEPDAVRAAITGVLSQSGFNFGCFRSPLNFGSIVECGGCCFWPKTIDRVKYEKELMRIGQFQYAIGLDRGYMRHPAQRTRSYVGTGFVMWKVYAYWKDAPKVNSLLMRALNPRMNRKHHPFLFLTFYVPNWQAVTKGLLGVDSFGNVESTIATMMENHRNFENTTETIHLPLRIPGMLKKVKTTKKGSHSLLALLLCFEATPAQADRAEKEDSKKKSGKSDKKPPSTNKKDNKATKAASKKEASEDKAVKNDEWVSVSKSKKNSNKAEATQEANEEEKIKKLINQDAHRLDPCKVFIAVSPSSIENETFDFIIRKKMVPLAKRILENPVACLLFHLEEPNRVSECKVIRKWFGNDAIARNNYSNGLAWSQAEMRTVSTQANATNRHRPADDLDFLEGMEDPTDAWQGILSLDPDSPELREYDDGLTVAGAMAEIQRFQAMEQEHFRTKAALSEQEMLVQQQKQLLLEQQELIARLQATTVQTSDSNPAKPKDVSMTSEEQNESSASRGGSSSTQDP